MIESDEDAYMQGRKALARELLGTAIRELGGTGLTMEELIKERAEAVAALRSVCGEHGDNEWKDDLHLADIITKHLSVHLRS